MDIINEIITSIKDTNISLADTLRRVLEFGYWVNNDELVNWIKCELEGYNEGVDLPSYRKLSCMSFGHFSGMFGKSATNMPIPTHVLPKQVKEFAQNSDIRYGVKAIEQLISETKEPSIRFSWPPEAIVLSADKVYEDMHMYAAYKSVSVSMLVQIIDNIKTKLLFFMLEIQRTNPNATSKDSVSKIDTKIISASYMDCISGSYATGKKH